MIILVTEQKFWEGYVFSHAVKLITKTAGLSMSPEPCSRAKTRNASSHSSPAGAIFISPGRKPGVPVDNDRVPQGRHQFYASALAPEESLRLIWPNNSTNLPRSRLRRRRRFRIQHFQILQSGSSVEQNNRIFLFEESTSDQLPVSD